MLLSRLLSLPFLLHRLFFVPPLCAAACEFQELCLVSEIWLAKKNTIGLSKFHFYGFQACWITREFSDVPLL